MILHPQLGHPRGIVVAAVVAGREEGTAGAESPLRRGGFRAGGNAGIFRPVYSCAFVVRARYPSRFGRADLRGSAILPSPCAHFTVRVLSKSTRGGGSAGEIL